MQKYKRAKTVGKTVAAATLASALALTLVVSPGYGAVKAFADEADAGKFYTDYATLEDAQQAAKDLQIQIASEGNVLLKNENYALPLDGSEYVSVFGGKADALEGYSLHDALEDEGFHVNGKLREMYAADTANAEITEFGAAMKSSFKTFGDAAIVVIGRGSGETRGAGGTQITTELATDADIASHAALGKNANEKEVKHSLMMTEAERSVIKTVKAAGFKKIIVLVSTAMPMEIDELKNDNAIDGIIYTGLTGQNGTVAAARILSGAVNPSGKTSDTWYADFTADPTWYNLGNNSQTGGAVEYKYKDAQNKLVGSDYRGLEYEEGIYRGYRYYETRAYEMNQNSTLGEKKGDEWYNGAMTYPFGYGLSYTTFSYSDFTVTLDDNTELNNSATGLADKFKSETAVAEVKTATAYITVTNTGNRAGKEAVELYSSAPYTGKVEKPYVQLVGFEKTKVLQPGEKQTLAVSFNIQDMASYDAEGAANDAGNSYKGYVLEGGSYTLHMMANSHGWADPDAKDYQKIDFSLDKTAYLLYDDFSGNKTANVYSPENGVNYTVRDNSKVKEGVAKFNVDTTANMTQLKRGDMKTATIAEIASFPKAPTEADLTLNMEILDQFVYWNNFKIGAEVKNFLGQNVTVDGKNVIYKDGQTISGANGKYVDETTDFPWVESVDEARMANWDQAATALTGKKTASILVSDMSGIDPNGTETVVSDNALINGKTESQAWDLFMNQLTWEQVGNLVTVWQKQPLESINFQTYNGADSSMNFNSTYQWNSNSVLDSTWNRDLAEKQGEIVGNFALLKGLNVWWGPGSQVHRSFFDNRGNEYGSDDPYLAGSISYSTVNGVQSKGVVACIKHCSMYDDSPSGGSIMGTGPVQWASEQTIREITLKSFQMAAQEGHARSVMGSFNRFGRMSSCTSYNTTTELFRNQWGCKDITWTTDIFMAVAAYSPADLMVRAGSDNLDTSNGRFVTGAWDASKKAVMVPTGENGALEESKVAYYTTRQAAMRIISMHADTAMNRNNVSFDAWATKALTATQGVQASGLSVNCDTVEDEASTIKYELVSGSLPEGLTLNANGTVTGTALEAGDYTFGVKCTADGWLGGNQTFTVKVASAFETDGLSGKAGVAFDGVVYSDSINVDNGFTAVVYSIADGKLPAGLTISEDGIIEGTPTESGSFPVTVNVAASKEEKIGSGRFQQTVIVTTNYKVNATIEVASGETVAPVDPLDELKTKLDELTEQNNTLKQNLTDLKTQNETLDKNITDISKQNTELKNEVNSLKASDKTGDGFGVYLGAGIVGAIIVAAVAAGVTAVIFVVRKKKNDK